MPTKTPCFRSTANPVSFDNGGPGRLGKYFKILSGHHRFTHILRSSQVSGRGLTGFRMTPTLACANQKEDERSSQPDVYCATYQFPAPTNEPQCLPKRPSSSGTLAYLRLELSGSIMWPWYLRYEHRSREVRRPTYAMNDECHTPDRGTYFGGFLEPCT